MGRVPLEPGKNSRATATAVDASVAPTATAEVEDHYEDEVDQNQNCMQPPAPPPRGRPQVYYRTVGLHHHVRYEIMTFFLN